jgi:hypothetical protein
LEAYFVETEKSKNTKVPIKESAPPPKKEDTRKPYMSDTIKKKLGLD